VTVNDRPADTHVPVHIGQSDALTIGQPDTGLRCYVSVSGGIEVPTQLGSRSTDVLSGIGPAPLRPGDVLPLGTPAGLPAGADELAPPRVPDELTVPVLLGPRDEWFPDAATQLAAGAWTVSPQSNRVGLRLAGTILKRAKDYAEVELASEGVLTGSVQVPAGGRPVIFLADHPTTGGYPVIGVAHPAALPALAQARPGTRIRLRPVP